MNRYEPLLPPPPLPLLRLYLKRELELCSRLKKSTQLLTMNRNNLSRLVQFLTGHNKLKRHKNLQNEVNDPYSCRLCLEDEETLFHVIAECPATQTVRSSVFKLPAPTTLPNPPKWTIHQVNKFLKETLVGDMLDQE